MEKDKEHKHTTLKRAKFTRLQCYIILRSDTPVKILISVHMFVQKNNFK